MHYWHNVCQISKRSLLAQPATSTHEDIIYEKVTHCRRCLSHGRGSFCCHCRRFCTRLACTLNTAGQRQTLPGKRALIITTSHGVLAAPGETEGPATGVMASEFTHPYYTFLDGGMEVDIASIQGGEIPIDPQTLQFMVKSPEDDRYLDDAIAQAKVKNSIPIAEVDIDQYDIVFISGGWGAAYDLAQSPVLAAKVSESYYGDKAAVIGGVCHGVLGLVNARDRDGKLLIAGRRMTGVTDKQIKELGIETHTAAPGDGAARGGRRIRKPDRIQGYICHPCYRRRRAALCYRPEPELGPGDGAYYDANLSERD